MRNRIKVKTSLAGSSEMSRVKSAKAMLELNHKEFLTTSLFNICKDIEAKPQEPSDSTIVQCRVLGKYIPVPYKVVKSAGYTNWVL